MRELEIYPRFQELLPPLMSPEAEQLEKSVLADGIREAILVWDNKIVDGHNRYALAKIHGLDFTVTEMTFDDEDAVCEWMLGNQLGRRNLEPRLKNLYIGQLYELQKKRQGGDRKSPVFVEENQSATVALLISQTDTAVEVADRFNVSPRTVKTAAKVAQAYEKADEETKEKFQTGKMSQKALVETAAPQKQNINNILGSDRFDEMTMLAKDYGNRFQGILREFKKAQSEMYAAFKAKNVDVFNFAPKLAAYRLEIVLETEAALLKRFEKCPACASAGCRFCNFGYVGGSSVESVKDMAGYTGTTFADYMEAKNGD